MEKLIMKQNAQHVRWTPAVIILAMSVQPAAAFYDPSIQRWINRDPIGETGGANISVVAGNNVICNVDPWGKASKKPIRITPLPPPLPPPPPPPPLWPETPCDPELQRYAEYGLDVACDAINSDCFAQCMNDPGLVQSMRDACSKRSAMQFRCPAPGEDAGCDEVPTCAYTRGGADVIVLCPLQINNQGGCQTITPGCSIAHELAHIAGVPGKGAASAEANTAEKCVPGCKGGGKHPGEP
jgi:hypothetical protein